MLLSVLLHPGASCCSGLSLDQSLRSLWNTARNVKSYRRHLAQQLRCHLEYVPCILECLGSSPGSIAAATLLLMCTQETAMTAHVIYPPGKPRWNSSSAMAVAFWVK